MKIKEFNTYEGYIKSRVPGGFEVILEGNRTAFLPSQHVDCVPLSKEDMNVFLYQKCQVKVLLTQPEIIVSRKAYLIDQEENRKRINTIHSLINILKNFRIGDVIHGTVTDVKDYGLFIDIGIMALAHANNFSNNEFNEFNKSGEFKAEDYKSGDQVTVEILSISSSDNNAGLNVSLALKGENNGKLERNKRKV